MIDSVGVGFSSYVKFKEDETAFKDYLENNLIKSNLYFICRPPEFVNDIYDMLIEMGIKEDKIKTERYG